MPKEYFELVYLSQVSTSVKFQTWKFILSPIEPIRQIKKTLILYSTIRDNGMQWDRWYRAA